MTLPGLLVLQPVALLLVVALFLHEHGRRVQQRSAPSGLPTGADRQAWLFRVGAGVGALALVSPLASFASDDLLARALLEALLGWVAAPLIVLGAPWAALAAALDRHGGSRRISPRPAEIRGHRLRTRVVLPLAGIGSYLATVWVFHVPAIEDPTVHSLALRSLELCCVLASGVLLWTQLVGSTPFRPGWEPLGRVVLVALALGGTWLLAAPMVYASTSWYPAFATGPTALLDASLRQQLAGGALWTVPAIPLSIVTFWFFGEWLRRDDEDEWRLRSLVERAGAPSETTLQELKGR